MSECLIVIASFADGYLDGLLNSIKENTTDVDYEIQVVDNHPSKEKLQECVIPVCEAHGVPLHMDVEITGYGDALNTGVEVSNSTSKYILYMDSDTKVSKGWLREMIDCYERHREEGCRLVGPRVKKFDETYLEIMPQYADIEYLENNDVQLPDNVYLVGVCYLRERDTLPEFRWDKNFLRAYWEDNDFTEQVRFWNYKIWVAGKALMYHKVNSSHETMKSQGINPSSVGYSNKVYFNQKWEHVYANIDSPKLREMTLGTHFTRRK